MYRITELVVFIFFHMPMNFYVFSIPLICYIFIDIFGYIRSMAAFKKRQAVRLIDRHAVKFSSFFHMLDTGT